MAGQSEFDFRDNTENSINGVLWWQLNSHLQWGPTLGFTDTEFDNRDNSNNQHNDVKRYNVGINLLYQYTENTLASLNIGYQDNEIDDDANNTLGAISVADTNEDDTYVGNLTITNQLNDVIDHQLQFSFRQNLGTAATVNLNEDFTATYAVNWDFIRYWTIRGQLNFLKSRESSAGGENAEIYTTSAGINRKISAQSDISLDYKRTEKFSSQNNRDYERNEIRLLLGYDF